MSRRKPPLSSDGKNARCHWCDRVLNATTAKGPCRATRDHVYPAWRGGGYRVWCCFACNNLKGAMLPNEWRSFMAKNPEWWRKVSR